MNDYYEPDIYETDDFEEANDYLFASYDPPDDDDDDDDYFVVPILNPGEFYPSPRFSERHEDHGDDRPF